MPSNLIWSTLLVTLMAIDSCTAVHAQTSAQASEATRTQGYTGIPRQSGWVTDTANLLSAADRKKLSAMLDRYHRETHHQLVVLTVATLSGGSIETFSLRVANDWAPGYAGLDNGILVTVAPQERQIRIELGRGMQRYISDEVAQSIIATSMTPAFRKGDYAGGLELGLKRLMDAARAFIVDDRSRAANPGAR